MLEPDQTRRSVPEPRLVRLQRDLHDLLQPRGTQLDGHAEADVVQAVLPLQIDGAGQDLLRSLRIASTICMVAALGAKKALPFLSSETISPPPLRVRSMIASTRSGGSSSVIGIPATVEYRGSGTISSPWPPSTKACVFSTLTFNSMAMKARMRALSKMPACPMIRSRGSR